MTDENDRFEDQLENIFQDARDRALELLLEKVNELVPHKYTMRMMVGWGLTFSLGKGEDRHVVQYWDDPELEEFHKEFEIFEQLFGLGNEIIAYKDGRMEFVDHV